jgi:predicted  nucleic acid-binding Zn-ribbon protein
MKTQLSPDAAPSTANETTSTSALDVTKLKEEHVRLTARVSQLEQELLTANSRIQRFEATEVKGRDREIDIRKKMHHGLSREQAIVVLDRQERFDAAKSQTAA